MRPADVNAPTDAPTDKDRRIPSLDGLRAISILAVMLGHAQGTRGFPDNPVLHLFGDTGNLGVRVFFVISGFLITSLLLAEQERNGRISLRVFYLRRALRICPACYVYIIVIGVLGAVGAVEVRKGDLVFAATYTNNFVADRSWVLGHLWSLAVEEQFYLLWPAMLCLGGRRRAVIGAIAVVAVSPLLRISAWYLLPEHRGIVTKASPQLPMPSRWDVCWRLFEGS
jgi:peptidoglycan/LPS O-acetylase OafA/YrhL